MSGIEAAVARLRPWLDPDPTGGWYADGDSLRSDVRLLLAEWERLRAELEQERQRADAAERENGRYCGCCIGDHGESYECARHAAWNQETRRLREQLAAETRRADDYLQIVQRFQPEGSPPPLTGRELIFWILQQMADRAERAESVLRKVEWHAAPPRFEAGCCPCCGREKSDGHAPDCELAAALKGGRA